MGGFSLLAAASSALFDAGTFWILANLWGAAVHALAAWAAPGFGVVLNQRGITLRGWSTRSYPWSQVEAIESVNFLGAKRVQVRLTRRPKKIRMWAPYDDFLLTDLKFDQRLEALQRWHADHRPDPF